MFQRKNKTSFILLMMFIGIVVSLQVPASDEVKMSSQSTHTAADQISVESTLALAREKLGYAFDAYREGDIERTKKHLDTASGSLLKALDNSKSEKTRDETSKLATEIEDFKTRLNQLTKEEENSIARFWHRATSLIKREAEQLIQDYVDLSTSEKILKHLLDAKMHFYNAEHDLFISHDAEDAGIELTRTLEYLTDASQIHVPEVQRKIILLSQNIQSLKDNLSTTKEIWSNDSVIQALDKALDNLTEVDINIAPSYKLRIETIKADIQTLRVNLARENIKNRYDSAMTTLRNIINEL